MIVPVMITALVMLPFLLFVAFPYESLIPRSIKLHELPASAIGKKPVNPNIPYARGKNEEDEQEGDGKAVSLEEVMNPFLDKKGAAVGAIIMATTLVTILVLNAVDSGKGHAKPVYWVTLPAAFVLFCYDVAAGWRDRHQTRSQAREGRQEFESARAERRASQAANLLPGADSVELTQLPTLTVSRSAGTGVQHHENIDGTESPRHVGHDNDNDQAVVDSTEPSSRQSAQISPVDNVQDEKTHRPAVRIATEPSHIAGQNPKTLVSICEERYRWSQETFPTVMAVISHLPFALVPFGLCMFILVQGLASRGWISVFAYGWDHWVGKTGTVGA